MCEKNALLLFLQYPKVLLFCIYMHLSITDWIQCVPQLKSALWARSEWRVYKERKFAHGQETSAGGGYISVYLVFDFWGLAKKQKTKKKQTINKQTNKNKGNCMIITNLLQIILTASTIVNNVHFNKILFLTWIPSNNKKFLKYQPCLMQKIMR